MTSVEILRNTIIDKLLSIEDEEFLEVIHTFLQSNSDEIMELTNEQMEMIRLGQEDYKKGKIISQSDVDEMDKEWLS